MRVDVNVSVNGGQRCEIKNLFSTSAVVHAIKAEFERQKRDIKSGKKIASETRGWDGKNTWKLRGKEGTVDYRYMPDPELMPISVSSEIIEEIRKTLPKLPDEIFQELLEAPFAVPVVDARTLMNIPGLVDYYYQVYDSFAKSGGKNASAISNWIVHRLLGEINQNDKEFSEKIIPSAFLADLIVSVEKKKITKTSGSLILKHLISNGIKDYERLSIDELIKQFDLGRAQENVDEELERICRKVIERNPDVIERIKGNPKSIKFLVGQVMRECQGRVEAGLVEEVLKRSL